jgi:hypothetical protein
MSHAGIPLVNVQPRGTSVTGKNTAATVTPRSQGKRHLLYRQWRNKPQHALMLLSKTYRLSDFEN